MEKKSKTTPSSSSSSSSSAAPQETYHYPPWLDLPDPLTDLILDRLPLSDYVRFAAVCPKWLSIQTNHRLRRHGPILPLPWLIPSYQTHQDSSIECFSLSEQRFYHFPSPPAGGISRCLSSSNGWLLLLNHENLYHTDLSLLNPVSGHQIPLPLLHIQIVRLGCISSPPLGPDCVVAVVTTFIVYLWRHGDPGWTKLPLSLYPSFTTPMSYNRMPPYFKTIAACKGKFCLMCNEQRFFVLDPLAPTPVIKLFVMDRSQFSPPNPLARGHLIESDGEILCVWVMKNNEGGRNVRGLRVFRADLSRRMWERVECLGGRVLFLSQAGRFSLSAADVGGRGNEIWFTRGYSHGVGRRSTVWRAFNLKTSMVRDGQLPCTATKYLCSQFRISLLWFIPAFTSGDLIAPTGNANAMVSGSSDS